MMVSVDDFDRFLFVVGAPRCGTTTLAQFLRGHPDVSFPAVKEPHFFSLHDLRDLGVDDLNRRVQAEYLERFFSPEPRRRVGADASVTYLYMADQLEPALRLWPNSKFIVAVRDPLSMLPSLHRRLMYIGDETIPNFADAWAAVPDRAAGRRVPRRCADERWLRYDEAPRFASHLERLFQVVGRERCHVVVFDDLEADPAGEYRRMMSFCGLRPVQGIDFSARRPGKDVRYLWLQRLLKRPPKPVRDIFAGEKAKLRDGESLGSGDAKSTQAVLSLRKRLLRWNRVPAVNEPLSPQLVAEIRVEFESEVERLEQLLGRDFSHWLGRDAEGRADTAVAAE